MADVINPRISVVMPVYNSSVSLPRAIESILCQTIRDFEFIIVNEFESNDESRNIIARYANKDARIKFIQLEQHAGLVESLNIGLRQARGQYIARMDADDYSYPNRFEMQISYLEKHPEVCVLGTHARAVTPFGEYAIREPTSYESIKARLLFSNCIVHPTVMFLRKVFEDNHWSYSDKYLCEDYYMWAKIDCVIENLPQVLLDYYEGKDSASKRYRNRMYIASLGVVKWQLQERLLIDTWKYHEKWFWPKKYADEILEGDDIIDGYRLLLEIEEQNKRIGYYSPVVLIKELCQQWNQYVNVLFVHLGGYENAKLPFLTAGVESTFSETLAKALKEPSMELEKEIFHRWQAARKILKKIKKNSQVVVFGAGRLVVAFLMRNPRILSHISCFCDNNQMLQGTTILGKAVISPNDLKNIDYDWLVIAPSQYLVQIQEQLCHGGYVDSRKITSVGILRYFKFI